MADDREDGSSVVNFSDPNVPSPNMLRKLLLDPQVSLDDDVTTTSIQHAVTDAATAQAQSHGLDNSQKTNPLYDSNEQMNGADAAMFGSWDNLMSRQSSQSSLTSMLLSSATPATSMDADTSQAQLMVSEGSAHAAAPGMVTPNAPLSFAVNPQLMHDQALLASQQAAAIPGMVGSAFQPPANASEVGPVPNAFDHFLLEAFPFLSSSARQMKRTHDNSLPSAQIVTDDGRAPAKRIKRSASPSSDDEAHYATSHSSDDHSSRYGDSDHDRDDTTKAAKAAASSLVFSAVQHDTDIRLLDERGQALPEISMTVNADKGFTYSVVDKCFVCQKKNHFQVSAAVTAKGTPKFVEKAGQRLHIKELYLRVLGRKKENPACMVGIEQSQADRSKIPLKPVPMTITSGTGRKTKAQRLHFAETTANNIRKKGKPNPDQRYFVLEVSIVAVTEDPTRGGSATLSHAIARHQSESLIVRASNPGQFEHETADLHWQRGKGQNAITHHGNVGINTMAPKEALDVKGNIRMTGRLLETSDERVKEDITQVDTSRQLDNVRKLPLYRYNLKQSWASSIGREDDRAEVGVLAQQLQQVLPDAVRSQGRVNLSDGEQIDDLLVVDKERLFMEGLGAVQEVDKTVQHFNVRMKELELYMRYLKKRSLERKRQQHGGRRRHLRKASFDIADSASGTGFDPKDPAALGATFPLGRLLLTLGLCLVIATALAVGVVMLIEDKHSNPVQATPMQSTPASTSGPKQVFGTTCLDGTTRQSASECPIRISFAFAASFDVVAPKLEIYLDELHSTLATVMKVDESRITHLLAVPGSIINSFFLEPTENETPNDVGVTEAVSYLTKAVVLGTLHFDFDNTTLPLITQSLHLGPGQADWPETTPAASTWDPLSSSTTTTRAPSSSANRPTTTVTASNSDETTASPTFLCENYCNQHYGTCMFGNDGAYEGCSCHDGWLGEMCSLASPTNTYLSMLQATPIQANGRPWGQAQAVGTPFDPFTFEYNFDLLTTNVTATSVDVEWRWNRFSTITDWFLTKYTVTTCGENGTTVTPISPGTRVPNVERVVLVVPRQSKMELAVTVESFSAGVNNTVKLSTTYNVALSWDCIVSNPDH